MNLEIHNPELVQRLNAEIQSRCLHGIDQLLEQALDALDENHAKHSNTLDWAECPVVESVSGRLSGAWVFRDTRLPVSTVFSNLEDGATVDEITEWFRVPKEQVLAVLEFAARSVAAPGHAALRDTGPF